MLSTQKLAELRLQLLEEKQELEEHFKQNDHFGLDRGITMNQWGSYRVMIIIRLMKEQTFMNVKRILL